MIEKIRSSLLSNDKPQDKNVMWIDTSNPESFTLKLFRNGDWKPLHVVGTTRDMIERELTGYVTSHYHSYDKIINKPTTLTGYGITDCFNKTEIESLLNKKVTKVSGKSLSTNDFTNEDKSKLTNLENYDDTQIRELIAGKANLQHQHTVSDITDFPELYYDATTFFTSKIYPSDKYEELLEAVKAKKTVYAIIDEEGYISYVFFMSSTNSDGLSSRVLLTTMFADGGYLYMNTFVLQQSGMTTLRENITGKANKAATLAGYGITDAYTKKEVDAEVKELINTKANDADLAKVAKTGKYSDLIDEPIAQSSQIPTGNEPLWINPDEDVEEVEVYNRSQVDALLNTKQNKLTLTVKDNGNIVIGNLQGQTKEFMPATPSGDPMHYAYEAAGAVYNNTGADIVKSTPWANIVDDDADKTVVHKAGYWYLNGLGNITNEQMRRIFVGTNNLLDSASNYISLLAGLNIRTNIYNRNPSVHYTRNITNWSLFANQKQLEVIYLGLNDTYLPKPTNMGAIVRGCKNVFIIFCVFDCVNTTNFGAIADSAISLKYMWLKNIKQSINLQYCSQFANCCILYMIQNEAATSAITITLHADAYARAMANADILVALETHPNVSLASA